MKRAKRKVDPKTGRPEDRVMRLMLFFLIHFKSEKK